MNQLPLQAQSFDAVFMNATLHHSSYIRRALRGVARVLADGGSVMIVSEPVRSVVWPQDLVRLSRTRLWYQRTYVYHFPLSWSLLWLPAFSRRSTFPRSIERQLNQGDLVVAQELGKSYSILSRLWRHHLGRWAAQGVLLPIVYAISNMPLVMIAKKPRALPA